MAGALVGQARVVLGVESDRFNRDLERSRQQFRKTTTGMEQSAKRSSAVVRRSFRGLALGLVGAGSLGYAVRAAFQEMQEGEKVAAQTSAVLKSTGRVANVTAKDVTRLSEALAKKSGVDDDVIGSGQNLLLTFTKIRNETGRGNRIFGEATRAALDMSVAMGSDLRSAVLQVGKALNDPVRGLTALRRVGVQFTKEQQAQIKALVETGRVMDAQKLILRELKTEFGGSAAARGGTLAGQLEALRNEARELGAELLTDLTPAMKTSVAWLRKQIEAFRNGTGEAGKFKEDLRGMVQSLRSIAKAANGVSRAFGGWDNVARLALAAFAVSKLWKIAAAVRAIGTASYFTAGGMAAMNGAGGTGVVGSWMKNAGKWGMVGAAVSAGAAVGGAGVEESNNTRFVRRGNRYFAITTDPSGQTSELQISEAAARKYAPHLFGKPSHNNASTRKGGRGGSRPGPTGSGAGSGGGGGGSTGDGLSGIQRLELSASRAELTPYLSDDLAAAKKIAAYYRYRERTTKKTGDELYAIKQDTLAAEQRLTAIQQQIEDAATREQEKRAANARKAAEKRARRLRDQAAKAKAALPGSGPYANTSSGFNKAGVPIGKVKKDKESGTGASAAAQIRDFLVRWQEMQGQYGPNIRPPVTVNQTFSSTAPLATVDELARSARYAAFHFRHSLAG